jgi:hypothetical protein
MPQFFGVFAAVTLHVQPKDGHRRLERDEPVARYTHFLPSDRHWRRVLGVGDRR